MSYRTLVLALAASCGTTAGAQTAFFNDATDTIVVDGQTEITTACTYEGVVLFPAGAGAVGLLYNEWTVFFEDKMLYVGPAVVAGWNFPASLGIEAPVTATPDVWHHVAFVFDGSEERLYFDGSLVASRLLAQTVGNGDGPAYIGAIFRDGILAPSLIGYVQSIRLSNMARYSGASFPPPLGDMTSDANTLLLFNFDEPAGSTTVQDLSPLARVGTLGAGFPEATPPLLGPVVAEEPRPEPSIPELRPPMPNPAAATTTIRYELAEAAGVTLIVYDALGREVAVLAAGDRPAGAHSATIDVSRWPTGVYSVRLWAGNVPISSPLLVRR